MKRSLPKPEIITKKGKPVLGVLPIRQYQEILERIEDAEDVALIERGASQKPHYRPSEDVLADLAKS